MTKNEKISQAIQTKWQEPEYRKCVCLSRKGKATWNKGLKTGLIPKTAFKKGYKQSLEMIEKRRLSRAGYKHSEETKRKIGLANTGKPSWRWIEDRSLLNKSSYRSHTDSAYNDWRKQIYERDDWKCKISNQDCEGRIEAHHILNWVDHPELRYDVNNGITLCHAHHPRRRAEEVELIPEFQRMVSMIAN